jgi:sugar lactone lactonase YvrE
MNHQQSCSPLEASPRAASRRVWPLAFAFVALSLVSARADNVFVSFMGGDPAVQEYASQGIVTTGTTFASGNLAGASGIAFDSEGNLYVANATNGTINEYTASGGNPPGLTNNVFYSGLNSPSDIAFDQFGNLYVAENAGDDIVQITPGGSAAVFASGLANPSGLAFDSSGNLYVTVNGAPSTSYAIVKIAPSGSESIFVEANGTPGGPPGVGFGGPTPGLSNPQGLAFDGAGNLYVADYNNDVIDEFNSSGTSESIFASLPTGSNPHGIAFDSSGDLFVANFSHGSYPEGDMPPGFSAIEEYSSLGGSTPLQTFNDNTSSPSGLEDGGYIAIETDSGVPLLDPVPEPSGPGMFAIGTASLVGFSALKRRRRG